MNESGIPLPQTWPTDSILDLALIREALLIRKVEEAFLDLFGQGKLNGTVHTCIGQEFSAVAFAGQLQPGDSIFSNHRCHGHFISFTKDYRGLIAEIMGKRSGVCGGVGSSQHLCKDNFFSNGIQGGIVPVAAGLALAAKLKGTGGICTVFIGDGTLGEGVVYETLNIAAKWSIPLLVICENNRYAQSTGQELALAGSIVARAEAFGIATRRSSTWEPAELLNAARASIDQVRRTGQPLFHLVDTDRLAPHSKGDDLRPAEELEACRQRDPLTRFRNANESLYREMEGEIDRAVQEVIDSLLFEEELPLADYFPVPVPAEPVSWTGIEFSGERQVDLLNRHFAALLAADQRALLLGEDVLAPYGGAFKVSRELSVLHPGQVLTTPISEQAIVGVANGLALGGMKPYAEVMFGDFITLCMDQIINHASKFHHMYNRQVNCPVVIRTPMGGGRGYGPTHSQTLDKFLLGIDNVTVVALNPLTDPGRIYTTVHDERHPVIVIENKLDYGRRFTAPKLQNYRVEQSTQRYPMIRLRPAASAPTLTVVTYGAPLSLLVELLPELIVEHDLLPEVLVASCIHPLDAQSVAIITASVERSGALAVIEEGSGYAGFGSEIIATVHQHASRPFKSRRIASLPVPIASARSLEAEILVNRRQIIDTLKELY